MEQEKFIQDPQAFEEVDASEKKAAMAKNAIDSATVPLSLGQDGAQAGLVPPKPPRDRKQMIMIACVVIIFGLFLLLLFSPKGGSNSQTQSNPRATVTPSAAPTTQASPSSSEYSKKLIQLEEQMKSADPAQIEVMPPQINLQERL